MAEPMDLDDARPAGRVGNRITLNNPFAIIPTIIVSSHDEAAGNRSHKDTNDPPTPTPAHRQKLRKHRFKAGKSKALQRDKNKVTKIPGPSENRHRMMTRSAYRRAALRAAGAMDVDDAPYLSIHNTVNPLPGVPDNLAKLPKNLQELEAQGFKENSGLITPTQLNHLLSTELPGFTFFLHSSGENPDNNPSSRIAYPGVTQLTEKQLEDLAILLNFNKIGRRHLGINKIKDLVRTLHILFERAVARSTPDTESRAYVPGDEKSAEFWSMILWRFLRREVVTQQKEQPGQEPVAGSAGAAAQYFMDQGEAIVALFSRLTSARAAYLRTSNETVHHASTLLTMNARSALNNVNYESFPTDDESEIEERQDGLKVDNHDQVNDPAVSRPNRRFLRAVDQWMAFMEERSGEAVDMSFFSALSL